jgi:hypothetical protein
VRKADALRVVLDFCRTNGPAEVLAAARVLEPVVPKVAGGVSDRGRAFAGWFRGTLAAEARLAAGWEVAWARCFDELLRLDGRTPEQVASVCQWARGHDFWRGAFLTPLKLRQRDPGGAMYFDRFLAAMAGGKSRAGGRAQPKGYAPRGATQMVRPEDLP